MRHHITKYTENGKRYAESWLQIDLFGKSFCFWKKRIQVGCEENGLKTCELVERLAKKDGVKEEYAEPYQDKKITVNGPARIFIVTD